MQWIHLALTPFLLEGFSLSFQFPHLLWFCLGCGLLGGLAESRLSVFQLNGVQALKIVLYDILYFLVVWCNFSLFSSYSGNFCYLFLFISRAVGLSVLFNLLKQFLGFDFFVLLALWTIDFCSHFYYFLPSTRFRFVFEQLGLFFFFPSFFSCVVRPLISALSNR